MMRPGESKRLKSNQSFNALVDHSITDVSYNMLCRIAMFLVRNILQYLYCKVKSLWCTWFQGIKFCSRSSTNPRFAKFKTVKTEPQLIICKSLGKEELKSKKQGAADLQYQSSLLFPCKFLCIKNIRQNKIFAMLRKLRHLWHMIYIFLRMVTFWLRQYQAVRG